MPWPHGASSRALLLGDPFQGDYGATFERPYNAADHLNIPTPSTPEAIHPDVLDMGTAWNGYRYWLAFTPYDGDQDTEAACIVATNDITDGGTWEVPAGYTHPLTDDPVGVTHLADIDLVYDNSADELVVVYVKTDESTFQSIFSKRTDGGGTWGTETSVLAGANNTYVNPSIIKVGSDWRIYYTKDSGAVDGVYFRSSSTGPDSGYGGETTCTHSLAFGVMQRKAQNLNVVKDIDGTLCTIISDGDSQGLKGALYFMRSTDGGTTFVSVGGPVLEQSLDGWDMGGIYRASVVTDSTGTVVEDDGEILLWYSGYLPNNTDWGTGFTRLPIEVLGG